MINARANAEKNRRRFYSLLQSDSRAHSTKCVDSVNAYFQYDHGYTSVDLALHMGCHHAEDRAVYRLTSSVDSEIEAKKVEEGQNMRGFSC